MIIINAKIILIIVKKISNDNNNGNNNSNNNDDDNIVRVNCRLNPDKHKIKSCWYFQ